MSKRSEQLRQKNREMLRQAAHDQMSKAHTLGVGRGAYAICQVVLQKANNPDLTLEERLTDIVQFCMKARNPDVKQEDSTQTDSAEEKQDEV